MIKVRPIYHRAKRRVEAHIFICFLAYLLAIILELRLRQAGLQLTAARAPQLLSRLQAVERTWEDQTVVVQATIPDRNLKASSTPSTFASRIPFSGSPATRWLKAVRIRPKGRPHSI